MVTPSPIDDDLMARARLARDNFVASFNLIGPVLEIGPARPPTDGRDTLDIKPGCTYQGNICDADTLVSMPYGHYKTVVMTEVLEHVFYPARALENVAELLEEGGLLIGTTPFNARIHGPLPDLWRFTLHGLRLLLCNWDDVKIDPIHSDRPLCPIGYLWTARCNKTKLVEPKTLTWNMIYA